MPFLSSTSNWQFLFIRSLWAESWEDIHAAAAAAGERIWLTLRVRWHCFRSMQRTSLTCDIADEWVSVEDSVVPYRGLTFTDLSSLNTSVLNTWQQSGQAFISAIDFIFFVFRVIFLPFLSAMVSCSCLYLASQVEFINGAFLPSIFNAKHHVEGNGF